ncbi:MAG: GNAT family N-acetyltransferase [Phycisphaerae bacterium]|nr:GNAT family N-acetyltransferase [Phycisphaerae bacterium]
MKLRQVRPEDAGALAEFYNGLSKGSKRTFRPLGEVTTLSACEDIIRDNAPETGDKFDLVALDGTQIAGWGFLWNIKSNEPTLGLGVADDYQGKGLGGKLMDGIMETARRRGLRKVSLCVVNNNHVARQIYEKRGFVRCGDFVGKDGLDYLQLAVELQPEEDP